MNISEILTQPDGTLVAIAGILVGVKAAKEISGTSPKCVNAENPSGQWSMWVQDITIQDATGKIKVGIKLEDPTFAFHDGMLKSPVSAEGEKSSYSGKYGVQHDIKRGKITHAAPAAPAPAPAAPAPQAPPNAAQNAAAINAAYQGHQPPSTPHPAQAHPVLPQGPAGPEPPRTAPPPISYFPGQDAAEQAIEAERMTVWGMCFYGLAKSRLCAGYTGQMLVDDEQELQALDKLANMCIDGISGANPDWVGEDPPPPTDEVPY